MTIPKWLLPVISIVGALAVGVAATFIGLQFKPSETVATTPETVNAPILQPVDSDQSETEWTLSTTDGVDVVTGPGGAASSEDPALDAIFERVSEANDAEAAVAALEADAADDPSSTGGDPCAPADDAGPADCPDGVTGTILPLVTAPALTGSVHAFDSRCPIAITPGSVSIGVLSSVPAMSTVFYWPADDTTAMNSVDLGLAPNAAAWYSQFPGALSADDLPDLVSCQVLPGLLPDTVYHAYAILTSEEASLPVLTDTVSFNSSGNPIRPPAEFITVGQNLLFVRGVHTADQRFVVQAWVRNAAPDAPEITCSRGNGMPLNALVGGRVDLSADDRAEINAPDDYVYRTTTSYRVPEGAELVLCARWYPIDNTLPSFERDVPLFQTMRVMNAPDRILPVLTATGSFSWPTRNGTLDVVVSTTEGVECGRTRVSYEGGWGPRDQVLCDPGVLAGASARLGGTVFHPTLWSQSFEGELVVTTIWTHPDGSVEDTTFEVDSRRGNCFGPCDLPGTDTFHVPIGDTDYDCGSSWRSVCVPIPGTEAGMYAMTLTWTQGLTNGVRFEWSNGPAVDGVAEAPQDVGPVMDTDERLQVDPDLDPDTHTASVAYDLVVDRPVTFIATLEDADNVASCRWAPPGETSASNMVTGSASPGAPAHIVWTDLCLGQAVFAQVTLTSPAGETSIYNNHFSPSGFRPWGIHGAALIAGFRVENLHYEVSRPLEARSGWAAAELRVGSVDILRHPTGPACPGVVGEYRDSGTIDPWLGTTTHAFLGWAPRTLVVGTDECVPLDALSYPFTIDLYTLLATGEQVFDISNPRGAPVHVRIWTE